MNIPPKSDIASALLSILVTVVCETVARREGAAGFAVAILVMGAIPGFFQIFQITGYLFMYFVLRRR